MTAPAARRRLAKLEAAGPPEPALPSVRAFASSPHLPPTDRAAAADYLAAHEVYDREAADAALWRLSLDGVDLLVAILDPDGPEAAGLAGGR